MVEQPGIAVGEVPLETRPAREAPGARPSVAPSRPVEPAPPVSLGSVFSRTFLVGAALNLMVGALLATWPAVAYHDLRVEKEGGLTEELGRVFE